MTTQTAADKALVALKQRAKYEASKRDHILSRFYYVSPNMEVATCKACNMPARVLLDPPVGGEHITGDAVFTHCSPPTKPAARPLTYEQVRNWTWQQQQNVYSLHIRNADGRPRRFRVTRYQTWKREPDRLFFVLSGGPNNSGHQRFEITNIDELRGWSLDDPSDYRYPNT